MPAPMTPERIATLEAMRDGVRVGQDVTTPDHRSGVVVAVEDADTLWPVVVEFPAEDPTSPARVRRYEAHELKE